MPRMPSIANVPDDSQSQTGRESIVETIVIDSSESVTIARQLVRKWAADMKFSMIDQTKLATAASELARNIYLYAQTGMMHIERVVSDARLGLRLVFEDHGPGIPDIEQAMQDGYTTGGGLGLGLGGTKRLVNEFDIVSEVNKGTKITITRWR